MLKRFWRWFYGEPDPDTTLEMLRIIVQNQEKTQLQMMAAVNSVVEAGQKQSEVLGAYLKLFQNSGDPQTWVESTPEEESQKAMEAMGFDAKWPEDKQAEWVLAHIDKL